MENAEWEFAENAGQINKNKEASERQPPFCKNCRKDGPPRSVLGIEGRPPAAQIRYFCQSTSASSTESAMKSLGSMFSLHFGQGIG